MLFFPHYIRKPRVSQLHNDFIQKQEMWTWDYNDRTDNFGVRIYRNTENGFLFERRQ